MRKKGLEPSRAFAHKILSLACLPIPTLPQNMFMLHYFFQMSNSCFFEKYFSKQFLLMRRKGLEPSRC